MTLRWFQSQNNVDKNDTRVEVLQMELDLINRHLQTYIDLNDGLENSEGMAKEQFIKEFILLKDKDHKGIYTKPMLKFTVDEMIRITYLSDYKVVKTVDEQIVDYYQLLKQEPMSDIDESMAIAVVTVLNLQGKTIKGINDKQ